MCRSSDRPVGDGAGSEWEVVLFRFARFLSNSRGSIVGGYAPFTVQHDEVIGDDLSSISFDACIFVVPGTRLEFALEIYLAPLFQILAADFRKLEGNFSGLTAKEAATAYQQSHSLVNYLVTTYGWHRVKAILEGLGKGMTTAAAIAAALQDYSIGYDGLVKEWRESLQQPAANR